MEFCPKCGAVLVQKRKNDGCPRCNYSAKSRTKIATSEKITEKKEIPFIKKNVSEVMPIVNEKCPKCGHDKAYFWTVQTRASDESETKFFKCLKCGHTHREYR
ncbi:MAG: transcription factor S [Candidatus Pacearchaeota archaeon]|jgi:DNA-directed RNA polymerase subunit M